jgi:hypothetical protein
LFGLPHFLLVFLQIFNFLSVLSGMVGKNEFLFVFY